MRWSFITDGNYIKFVHTDETDLHIQQTIHRLHNTSRCIDWSLPADTTRITFTIDESKYENISIYDVDFDGVVMTVQSDFETNITAMFTGLAGGGSSSYLVYSALLSQTGTNAPTIESNGSGANTPFQNTLSGAVVWSFSGTGIFVGTLAGAFPVGKVAIIFGAGEAYPYFLGGGNGGDGDSIYIATNDAFGAPSNDLLVNQYVEIRVYT